jgi:CubicO group peptidase (beta-lactamase class C family)
MDNSAFEEIERLIHDGAAPGCSVTANTNGRTVSRAYGHYSDQASPQVTPHTVYDLASITKMFTTAIILQLHESGKLSIYDTGAKFLDNFRNSKLRMIDLLTHRVHFPISLSDYRRNYLTDKDLYSALMQIVPPVQAADHIEYANLEMLYLGEVAEKVSGHPLTDLMHELFQSLGLNETYTSSGIAQCNIATPPTEIAEGTTVVGVTHDETARMLGGLSGHAGVFSTSEDLAAFGQAWLDGSIVKTAALQRALFRDYDPASTNPQAIGWWLRYKTPDGGIKRTPGVYSHTGFTGSLLAINPGNGKVCAFVCNRTYYGRDNVRHRQIWQLLFNWIQE